MSDMSGKLAFLHILSRQADRDYELYNAIKAETELAPKSKKLGVRSLTFSLIFMLIIGVAIGGIALILNFMMESSTLFGIVLIVLIGLVAIYTTLALYIRAFRLMILQFKLNKHPIRWVALVLSILPTIVVIVMVIILVSVSLSK